MMDEIGYFAYSLHIDPRAMRKWNIRLRSQGVGFLEGYRLSFDVLEDEYFTFEKRGLANIVPSAHAVVEGVIYRIGETDLPKLDAISGVHSFKYYRKKVWVRNREGNFVEAVTYAGWPDAVSQGLKPSVTYLRQLLSAASRNGISPDFRHWLETHPTVF